MKRGFVVFVLLLFACDNNNYQNVNNNDNDIKNQIVGKWNNGVYNWVFNLNGTGVDFCCECGSEKTHYYFNWELKNSTLYLIYEEWEDESFVIQIIDETLIMDGRCYKKQPLDPQGNYECY
jgi:hypothetical protein